MAYGSFLHNESQKSEDVNKIWKFISSKQKGVIS